MLIQTELLVIGGGPAGLSAAAEAANSGASVIVVDSDLRPGGQLIKQTHKFFGSAKEYAGTRGFLITDILLDEIKEAGDRVKIYTNTTVTGYYKKDDCVNCVRGEDEYFKIKPKAVVVATGAQEKLIPFPNNHLPGVYGAGAVQTFMNVYGVVPGRKVVMVGAGNIGLIVSYQLLQAGVEVKGIVEAMPKVGGYWVHAAKIRRLGVPLYLRYTVKEAHGKDYLEGVTIMEIDENWKPTGKELYIECDVLCMAVGLSPTAELLWQAGCQMKYVAPLGGYVPIRDRTMRTSNDKFWVAGDAAGIEEASSAMIEGRIAGLSAAKYLGYEAKDFEDRFKEYWDRLNNLRGGEPGEKVLAGLKEVLIDSWGV